MVDPVNVAAEFDGHNAVGPGVLPGVAHVQPGVGPLGLVAVDQLLLEQAEPVADAHAGARDAQEGHGVQETGGQTAQAAVAQAGVALHLAELVQVLAHVAQAGADDVLNAHVEQIVVEQAPDEELHGEIVDLFFLVGVDAFTGFGADLGGAVAD